MNPTEAYSSLKLNEIEASAIDSAFEAKEAKLAPLRAQLKQLEAQVDAKFADVLLKVLKQHGLEAIPDIWKVTIKDPQGNLIPEPVFEYVAARPKNESTTPSATPIPTPAPSPAPPITPAPETSASRPNRKRR